jgi:CRISPR-associated protein Cas2
MLSGYRIMWMIVMFDLPVITKAQRKDANHFRLSLLDMGYLKCQLSIYAKVCTSKEQAAVQVRQIKSILPPKGDVDILMITDAQFQRIICFQERRNTSPKNQPKQLELF